METGIAQKILISVWSFKKRDIWKLTKQKITQRID